MESIKPVAVSPKSSQDVINVVIIGCGYAGALVAKRIDDYLADKYFKVESSSPKSNTINPMKKEIKLTVIDRHDSVWLKISAIRSTVSEGWVQRTQIPISEVVKRGTFVQGNVTSVDKVSKKVYVSLTEPNATDPKKDASYPYDVLLCASGALNGSPADLPTTINTKSQINSYLAGARKSIEESTKIGIIGGGMTSVEFAGEIRAMYPDKKITIICAANELFASSIAKPTKTFMKALQKRLKVLRVDVIFNERAVNPNAKDFIETPYLSGTRVIECEGQTNVKLEVDLTIWAGSWRFNNSFYPSEWMNDMGELQIRDTFQLESESDVFAFGDISSFLETKQAITLVPKVDIIVNNIMTIAEMKSSFGENKKKSKLKVCKMNDRALIYLPLGANDGVSISRFGFTYGGKKTSEWKGKDLFVNKFWNLMTGHEAPSINASDS